VIDLSVVIVSWNTRALTEACLAAVCAAADGLRTETIIVDNASTDGTAEAIVAGGAAIRLIANSDNAGFARANNQAIAQCTGRYVLLLNSDTVACSGALSALVRFMDAHPEAGAAGPYLENTDGSLQPSCHPVLTPWREFWRLLFLERFVPLATYPMHRWGTSEPREVEVIKGACLLLRRSALDQVGLLDERYFMYSEEMDLCYRLARAGWKLFWVPEAHVVHHGGASSRQVAVPMLLALYRSKVQFQRKFGGKHRARLFKVLLGVTYLPRWLFAEMWRVVRPSYGERAGAYRRLLIQLGGM